MMTEAKIAKVVAEILVGAAVLIVHEASIYVEIL